MGTSNKINKVLEALDAASRLAPNQCPPMERRIEQNLAQFESLRAAGLKWTQIVLGLPSWSQKDGTPVSEDQLRGAFSRVNRKRKRGGSTNGYARAASTVPPPIMPTTVPVSLHLPAVAPPSSLKAPSRSGAHSSLSVQLALTKKSRRYQNG